MKTKTAAFTLSLGLLLVYPAAERASADTQAVNWALRNTASFDLLYHRAESTATGAAFGGLIGAGIEEGVRSSKDNALREALAPLVVTPCDVTIKNSFSKKLDSAGMDHTELEDTRDLKTTAARVVVALKLLRCGFKKTGGQDGKLSAFVEIDSSVSVSGQTTNSEEHLFIGKRSFSHQDLAASQDLLNDQLNAILRKAGKRLANKVIYGEKNEERL